MNVDFSSNGRILIVKITGDIDHHTSAEIKLKTEKEFLNVNGRDIVFDFTNVKFMDSSGIGMIIGRYKTLNKQGGQVVVSNINNAMYRLFEMAGLHKIINTFETADMAINDLNAKI